MPTESSKCHRIFRSMHLWFIVLITFRYSTSKSHTSVAYTTADHKYNSLPHSNKMHTKYVTFQVTIDPTQNAQIILEMRR